MFQKIGVSFRRLPSPQHRLFEGGSGGLCELFGNGEREQHAALDLELSTQRLKVQFAQTDLCRSKYQGPAVESQPEQKKCQ